MSGDLISREAAIAAVERRKPLLVGDKRIDVNSIINFLNNRPAVDAVEVIRCKNCMYSALLRDTDLKNESPWRYYHLGCRICMCNALIEDEPIIVEDDFFCKYGTKID